VVMTYTLCTIPDAAAALAQVRRVLRPGGRLLFCEHGAAPDAAVRRWQDRLDGLWGRLAGGCHLNREVATLIASAGFRFDALQSRYLPKTPRFAGYNTWGSALPD
jgi:ubiquinone/menaquinone biosynthesis C-methylase UbiE